MDRLKNYVGIFHIKLLLVELMNDVLGISFWLFTFQCLDTGNRNYFCWN